MRRETARQAELVLEIAVHTAGIGHPGHDSERGGREEIPGYRAPESPRELQGRKPLPLDEGLGIEAQWLPQGAQELGRAEPAEGGHEPGLGQRLAQAPADSR